MPALNKRFGDTLRAVMRRNVKLIKENMEQNSKLISVMESDTISGTFSGKKTL